MLTVSLLIEILRTKPRLVFWLAALTQGVLWLLVPSLFYAAPPGDVAEVLAVGRELTFGSKLGPPLAYWAAEIALRAAGGHMIGVYLLSQICILVTLWAVFRLGSSIVGERHAVVAVLLMTGISVFTIASPDFGPDILMMPLWALALLHLWRAAGEGRTLYWLALAADLGLMLLTSYTALLLVAILFAFLAFNTRARLHTTNIAAGAAAVIVVFLMIPSIILLDQYGVALLPDFQRLRNFELERNIVAWLRLISLVVVAHAGAGILIALGSNLSRIRRGEAAAITRNPVDPFARTMIYYFALTPIVVVTAFAVISGKSDLNGIPPLLVLSGLAVVVAAGDIILVHHQRLVSIAWFSLLLMPPALAAAGVIALPALFAVDLKVAQPADDIARYFTENFERRTGRRLEVVGGDPRLASVIALASSQRPRVLHDEASRRVQLATMQDAVEKGAIIVWRATDNAGTPPPQIKTQFPTLITEVPRAFERRIHGRAPLLRIGWGMIRPRTEAPQPPATPSQ